MTWSMYRGMPGSSSHAGGAASCPCLAHSASKSRACSVFMAIVLSGEYFY